MFESIGEGMVTGLEIAIIGMAGRFPGANSIDEFQDNLKNGIESISFFSDSELKECGISVNIMNHPGFVKTNGGVLEDKEYFDASFFEYSPGEAEVMHPQTRLFHECVWEALENAGYDPFSYDGLIGLYAGAVSSYDWKRKLANLEGSESIRLNDMVLAESNLMTLHVSYKLNLTGPSFTLQTTCSSSLVAVDAACRALLTGQNNIALAGGAALYFKEQKGYIYNEGMIDSKDGHCRAFDAKASGTVDGEGVGVVVLKLLEEAITDRDNVYAVIKGTACNNDGYRKVSFTAPSVKGQVEVIKTALKMAEVEPGSIGYIETHGTGTILGDPVEVEAVKGAFNTDKKRYCALGSVKTNIGHLAAAAGIAGLIKTVLALKNRLIPPSLHFRIPNPKIDFDNSPFYVNTKLKKWNNQKYPLRAGVSSFGFGGTNAHVILEEAPEGTRGLASLPDAHHSRDYQLILLSAKTPPALDKMTDNLGEYLTANPGLILADAAYTLQVGRRPFPYRRLVVGSNREEILEALKTSKENGKRKSNNPVTDTKPVVVFMFPGQGAQYVNMGLELYREEPVFREEMDRCFEILNGLIDYNIKEILYPCDLVSKVSKENSPPDSNQYNRSNGSYRSYKSNKSHIIQTEIAQPLLFAFEYALARLLMEWGIEPEAMIGHSIGEYVAACLSGVFSLEDALKSVSTRGKLMQEMPLGAMLSVPLGEGESEPLLKGKGLSLAAVNAPSRCVVSGTLGSIEAFEKELKQQGYDSRRLHTSHAFHSLMMTPVMKKFEEQVRQIALSPPMIRYISNITGDWVTGEEVAYPGYWARHLRETVRFADGMKRLLAIESAVFVEVGPGSSLSTFARQQWQLDKEDEPQVINLIRQPNKEISDLRHLIEHIGQLWLWGIEIDWIKFYAGEKRHRIPLPAYPFERQRYFPQRQIQPGHNRTEAFNQSVENGRKDISHWFYIPSWKLSRLPKSTQKTKPAKTSGYLLVFIDNTGLANHLINKLEAENFKTIAIAIGKEFSKENPGSSNTWTYRINPGNKSDYDRLFAELKELKIGKIIHLWNVIKEHDPPENFYLDSLEGIRDLGFYSLLYIARALGKQGVNHNKTLTIKVFSNYIHSVTGEKVLSPARAIVLGAVKTIPQEYSNLHCQSIDIDSPGWGNPGSKYRDKWINHLFLEIFADSSETVVAYRGTRRWVQFLEPIPLEKSPGLPSCLKEKGVYLITGGLGGMGLVFAQYLASRFRARLILMGRSPFPARDTWQEWLETHDENDAVSVKIKKLQEIERLGGRIWVTTADAADRHQVQEVIELAKKALGKINGIIHAAGIADEAGMIGKRSKKQTEKVLAAKVSGTLILYHLTKDFKPDLFLLCSSLSSVTGSFGQVGYSAANGFLDAFTHYKTQQMESGSDTGPLTVSINWDSWKEVGMSVNALKKYVNSGYLSEEDTDNQLKDGILPHEGIDVLERVLDAGFPQTIVSTGGFIHNTDNSHLPHVSSAAKPAFHTGDTEPLNEIEKKLADTWWKHLGVKKIAKNKDFYELGGDSLKAMTLVSEINKRFRVKITIPDFLTHPTIEVIAQLIDKTKKIPSLPIKSTGKKEFLFPLDEKTLARLTGSKTDIEDIYPLTPLQQQVVSYNLFSYGSGSDLQQYSWVMEGNLDISTFREAWQTLVQRHSILRTAFKWKRLKEPVQLVYHRTEIIFQQLDCTGMSDSEQKQVIENYIDRDKSSGFKISAVPLMRFGLILLNNGSYRFIWSFSLSLFDNWSLTIILKEVFQYYDYYSLKTKKTALPGKPRPFVDYVSWWMGQDQSRLKQFWESELEGFNGSMDLGVPRLSSDYISKDFEQAERIIRFLPREARRINTFAAEHRLTLGTLLQGTWILVLSHFSGENDILSGVLTYGRPPEIDGIESMVGLFINVLPLRINTEDDRGVIPWLRQVQDKMVRLRHFGFVSIGDIADWSGVPLAKIQEAVYERTLVMVKSPEDELISGLTEASTIKISQFQNSMKLNIPLRVYVSSSDDITIKLWYDRTGFHPDTVDEIANYWETLVRKVVKKPGTVLGKTPGPTTA